MSENPGLSKLKTDADRSVLTFTFAASLTIVILTVIASLTGLLYPDSLYPSPKLRQFALANDLVNLVIGLPILLVSMWLARRGKFIGMLLWPGALLYSLYNYLAYVIAVPLSWIYITYLLIVPLGLYALIATTARIDTEQCEKRLAGKVPERLSGGVLVVLGGFVFARVFSVVAGSVLDEIAVPTTDLALLVADVLLAPAWIIGGALLWRKHALGYATGLGLLFQGSMLFVGLIIVLALQPIFTAAVFPLTDIIAVTIMGLICFIPFALFLRSAWSHEAGS
jgi:hypothetical protein